jgi:dUTP pyrophosphatase
MPSSDFGLQAPGGVFFRFKCRGIRVLGDSLFITGFGADEMRIKIKKLTPEAFLPEYAHGPHEDAGMDLRAIEPAVLTPGVPRAVATGLAIELPPGFEAQLRPRSGLALKHSITLPNAPATIDPGYRGEIKVILLNLGKSDYSIHKGDRICQLVVARYEPVEWDEGELGVTRRGEGGFGSSGR